MRFRANIWLWGPTSALHFRLTGRHMLPGIYAEILDTCKKHFPDALHYGVTYTQRFALLSNVHGQNFACGTWSCPHACQCFWKFIFFSLWFTKMTCWRFSKQSHPHAGAFAGCQATSSQGVTIQISQSEAGLNDPVTMQLSGESCVDRQWSWVTSEYYTICTILYKVSHPQCSRRVDMH